MIKHPSLVSKPIDVPRLVKSAKLGRNDPCWCNSGKKYKKCHLNRDREEKAIPAAIGAKAVNRTKHGLCRHPSLSGHPCSLKAIGSHTIQRRGGLEAIAENGHVLTVMHAFGDLDKSQGNPNPKPIGVRKASIFPLFCNTHDTQAFKHIEGQTLTVDEKAAFLFSYRAMAMELFLKEINIENFEDMKQLDKGLSYEAQMFLQNTVATIEAGTRLGIRDLKAKLVEYDRRLLQNDYSGAQFSVVVFGGILPIVTSCSTLVEYDFEGKELQRLFTDTPELDDVAITVSAYDGNTICCFSWLGSTAGQSKEFAESFLRIPDNEKAGRLIDACFTFSENTYLRISWWNNLSDLEKIRLKDLYWSGTPRRPRLASDLSQAHRFPSAPPVLQMYKSWL